jgi:hypothetical protein
MKRTAARESWINLTTNQEVEDLSEYFGFIWRCFLLGNCLPRPGFPEGGCRHHVEMARRTPVVVALVYGKAPARFRQVVAAALNCQGKPVEAVQHLRPMRSWLWNLGTIDSRLPPDITPACLGQILRVLKKESTYKK